ncbi:hypothetical protein Gotur_010142, partial [Gossypium turneri]
MLSPYAVVDEDQFLAFSRAGADGFQFVLASLSLLLLCDVRKPMLPLLRWAHALDNPCFIDSDEFGGFTLIRLMSSGRIEAQRYCASWDLVQNFNVAHREPFFNFGDSLLYALGDDEYEFPKRFKYLNLDYLRGYLNDNLAEGIDSRIKKSHKGLQQKESFNLDFHEILCEKLKLLDVPFDDMTMPLEFSVVPDLPQLPPFLLRKPSCRSTKWSHKMQPDDSLVGPVLPLPILLTLHEFRNGCPDSEKMC